MTCSDHQLAVVVPAYKGDFLAKTLACIKRQTDQNFNLYIFDDASQADIQGIVRLTLGPRRYTYKRFDNNLGGMSLAKHWNRCVAMSTEPWIWLFSDDDLMDDNCVAVFHKFLKEEGESTDLFRFEGWVVDEDDKVIAPQAFDPDHESWLEFTYGYLMGWRWSFMQKLVFRRSAFEKAGNFLDLPLCWKTDDAAVIAIGRHQKIRRLPGARVFWRHSRQNISPDRSVRTRAKKLRAACLFLYWLQRQLEEPREHLFDGDQRAFVRAMDRFLAEQVMEGGLLPAIAYWNLLSHTRLEVCHGSRWSLLKYIALAAVKDGGSAFGRGVKMLAGRSGK